MYVAREDGMAEMIRKQVYIEGRQERLLKERAKKYRVTEAELIRRAIDRGLERTAAGVPDPEAWKRVEAFIARHRKQRLAQRKRGWTRDELYDV
jgi:hypothetical protein